VSQTILVDGFKESLMPISFSNILREMQEMHALSVKVVGLCRGDDHALSHFRDLTGRGERLLYPIRPATLPSSGFILASISQFP
jgi:hypothetical protein